jgi:prevent-host-death family protein
MKALVVSEDIFPIGEFKKQASRLFRRVRDEKHSIVVTQNGTPIGVVVPPEEYDLMAEHSRLMASINAGLADVKAGRVVEEKVAEATLASKFGPLKP